MRKHLHTSHSGPPQFIIFLDAATLSATDNQAEKEDLNRDRQPSLSRCLSLANSNQRDVESKEPTLRVLEMSRAQGPP